MLRHAPLPLHLLKLAAFVSEALLIAPLVDVRLVAAAREDAIKQVEDARPCQRINVLIVWPLYPGREHQKPSHCNINLVPIACDERRHEVGLEGFEEFVREFEEVDRLLVEWLRAEQCLHLLALA